MATDRDIRFRVIVDGKEAERSLKDLQGDLRQTGKLAETSAAGFGAMSQSLAGLAAGFLSARAAIGFFAESLRLAGEQERAVVQLNTALKSTGQYSQAASQELQDYASTLQGLTGNGSETIIGVEKMLATFKLAPDVIKKATLATLDLAEATGQDLMSAAILVGKAAVGETGMLKRYGIVVDEAKLKAEGFKAVLDELRTEFGGQAQARMETYIGKVDALKAAFGDLREAWAKTITRGKALRAVLDGLTGALRTSASQLNETERQTQIRIKEFNAQILFARAHSPKVSKEDRAAALAKLHALPGVGPELMMFLLVLVWIADSAAYFSGRALGRHKLAPAISPGKTVEGALGALVSALVPAGFLIWSGWVVAPGWMLVLLCTLTVAVSIGGDLWESVLKRERGVKDSGDILPGHGGVLDRIDSQIAASPFFVAGLMVVGVPL